MTAARRYDIADFMLDNWGRAMRIWRSFGLGFPKVSVYAREYYPDKGNVWDGVPVGAMPDEEQAQRVEDELQAMKNEGARGYKCYMTAKIKHVDFGGKATMEDVKRHLSKHLKTDVSMRAIEYYLAEVRERISLIKQ